MEAAVGEARRAQEVETCDGVAAACQAGACLKSLLDPDSKALSFVAFSPNGKFVLTASLGGKLTLWEYEKSRVVKTYQGAGPYRDALIFLCCSPTDCSHVRTEACGIQEQLDIMLLQLLMRALGSCGALPLLTQVCKMESPQEHHFEVQRRFMPRK